MKRASSSLDASVMPGPRSFAARSLPSELHVPVAGREARHGADRPHHAGWRRRYPVRKAWDFPRSICLTERSRIAWMTWKQSLRDPSGRSYWIDGTDAPPKAKQDRELRKAFPNADADVLAYAWERGIIRSRAPSLPGIEEKRDVGSTTTSGMALEDPRAGRRFANHRRRSICRSGSGRGRSTGRVKRISGFARAPIVEKYAKGHVATEHAWTR